MDNFFNFKIIVLIILGILVMCFISEKKNRIITENYQNYYDITLNANQDYNINLGLNPLQDMSKNNKPKKDEIYYLYWTGGYDSTFRLCEMLINESKTVQPIYVSLVLDNDCKSEETCNKLWLRRNRKEERKAMQNIINVLREKYPFTKKTLLPLLEVDKHIEDNIFNYKFENLFYEDNLWPRKRKTHQYLFLSKYAYYHKKNIDIGVLGIHEGSKFAIYLRDNLVLINGNYELNNKNHPLGYLTFPLYGRSKEDLLEKATLNNYQEILKLTWSCWFPRNGKPCKRCPMCRERIVEHPN